MVAEAVDVVAEGAEAVAVAEQLKWKSNEPVQVLAPARFYSGYAFS